MSSGAWTASKLSVTRWWRNCHSHQMVEKLSQSPHGGETVTVIRWWRNCHSHHMVEKLSQSPHGWRNCHSHQMVEKLSQSPDGGETVTVTRWWRNCHSHQMVEKLSQSPHGWRNCHSHHMVEKLSQSPHGGETVTVTTWWRNCHSHQMVEKLSQSPHGGETVTVTRWWRNCHSHQMVEKLSQSPDGGETVTVTTWWRNCHSHQKTWKSISHITTNTRLRVQTMFPGTRVKGCKKQKYWTKPHPFLIFRGTFVGWPPSSFRVHVAWLVLTGQEVSEGGELHPGKLSLPARPHRLLARLLVAICHHALQLGLLSELGHQLLSSNQTGCPITIRLIIMHATWHIYQHTFIFL